MEVVRGGGDVKAGGEEAAIAAEAAAAAATCRDASLLLSDFFSPRIKVGPASPSPIRLYSIPPWSLRTIMTLGFPPLCLRILLVALLFLPPAPLPPPRRRPPPAVTGLPLISPPAGEGGIGINPFESSSAPDEVGNAAGEEAGEEFCDPNGESERLKQGDGETPGPIKSAQGRNSDTPASASETPSNFSASLTTTPPTDGDAAADRLSLLLPPPPPPPLPLPLPVSLMAAAPTSALARSTSIGELRRGDVVVAVQLSSASVADGVCGGADEVAEAVVAQSKLAVGSKTGRLTRLTVGTNLRTPVAVAVVGVV